MNSKTWQKAADRFAAFVVALHFPWDLQTHAPGIELTYTALQAWFASMRNESSFLSTARMFWIKNLAQGMNIEADSARLIQSYRCRQATKWNAEQRKDIQQAAKSSVSTTDEAIGLNAQAIALFQARIDSLTLEPKPSDAVQRANIVMTSLKSTGVLSDHDTPLQSIPSSSLNSIGFSRQELRFNVSEQQCKSLIGLMQTSSDISQQQSSPATSISGTEGEQALPSRNMFANTAPHPDLNSIPGANDLFVTIIEHINGATRFRLDPAHNEAPKPRCFLIHGGAGKGKSHFVKLIQERLNERDGCTAKETLCCVAPTGIAASGLNGYTIHTAFGVKEDGENKTLPSSLSGGLQYNPSKKRSQGNAAKIVTGRQLFGSADVLVIDEISMCSDHLLCVIDERLRKWFDPSQCFGGKLVLALGDFFQLPPTGGTSLLKTSKTSKAHELFSKFEIINFTVEQRAANDKAHVDRLNFFRDPSLSMTPVKDSKILDHLQTLSIKDVEADEKWKNSVIVVSENVTRMEINRAKAIELARRTNQPIVAWAHVLDPGTERFFVEVARKKNSSLLEVLKIHPELIFYFVKGAPAVINDNIAPDKQLANGTRCQLHSLNLDDESWNLVEHAQAGQVIWLSRPPISVNVEILDTEKMISAGWNPLHTLIPERFVIPLLTSRYPSKFEAVTVKKPRKIKHQQK